MSIMKKAVPTKCRGGHHGLILRVDLTDGEIWEEALDPEILSMGLGGIGLAMPYFYRLANPQTDWRDPETPIIFFTDPLTNTNAPSSGGYILMSKSPLSGLIARGQSNGHLGARLKSCGYDGIIITGKADKPTYILLRQGDAELKDATELWGLSSFEAEERMKKAVDDPRTSAATIGVSGERLVRNACVQSDHGHMASSGGIGAVWGDKNLKGLLVVSGNAKTPLADAERTQELIKKWFDALTASKAAQSFRAFGTAGAVEAFIAIGNLPTKNLTTNDESIEYVGIAGKNVRAAFEHKKKTCYKCPVCHVNWMKMPEGNKYGVDMVEEPEYEGLAAFGPLIGNKDVYANDYMNHLIDEYCMDYKTCGFIISLCIECFEAGLLTKERTDGLELTWGNADAAIGLLHKIGRREGEIGEALSGGVMEAAEWIGGDAINRAVYAKRGAGLHVHDPHSQWPFMLGHTVCEFPSTIVNGHIGMGPALEYGFDRKGELEGRDAERIGMSTAALSLKGLLNDLLVCCDYCCGHSGIQGKQILEVLAAATGRDMSYEDGHRISGIVLTLARCWNLRAGFKSEEGIPSERLLRAPIDGPNKGKSAKPYMRTMVKAYYKEMGWDIETSKPLTETLQKYGIAKFVGEF